MFLTKNMNSSLLEQKTKSEIESVSHQNNEVVELVSSQSASMRSFEELVENYIRDSDEFFDLLEDNPRIEKLLQSIQGNEKRRESLEVLKNFDLFLTKSISINSEEAMEKAEKEVLNVFKPEQKNYLINPLKSKFYEIMLNLSRNSEWAKARIMDFQFRDMDLEAIKNLNITYSVKKDSNILLSFFDPTQMLIYVKRSVTDSKNLKGEVIDNLVELPNFRSTMITQMKHLYVLPWLYGLSPNSLGEYPDPNNFIYQEEKKLPLFFQFLIKKKISYSTEEIYKVTSKLFSCQEHESEEALKAFVNKMKCLTFNTDEIEFLKAFRQALQQYKSQDFEGNFLEYLETQYKGLYKSQLIKMTKETDPSRIPPAESLPVNDVGISEINESLSEAKSIEVKEELLVKVPESLTSRLLEEVPAYFLDLNDFTSGMDIASLFS